MFVQALNLESKLMLAYSGCGKVFKTLEVYFCYNVGAIKAKIVKANKMYRLTLLRTVSG